MISKSAKLFLTDYICSLRERTRVEKGTIKFGLDWVIYQLGMAKGWNTFRLPFFRQTEGPTGKTKTEAEFGEDISFLSASKKEYLIFVIKDHMLNNKNWRNEDFDTDIRKAGAPKLTMEGLERVTTVRVILAYNKDENHTGVELYDRLVATLGRKVGEDVKLSFERWNLTKMVEEIGCHLLSAELLPQHLAGHFHYICSQAQDFDYGSKEWDNQLLPNWRNFLRVALDGPVDERKVRLIPVALTILNHHRKETPNSHAGWIDLIEWGMLALWECWRTLPNGRSKKLKSIITHAWFSLYVAELEQYFLKVEKTLTSQHGLSTQKGLGAGISAVNDAYLAFWHIGRLGVMMRAPQDFEVPGMGAYDEFIQGLVSRSADWLVKFLRANPGALRPLIDLHHIELFLVWAILWQNGREEDIYEWLCELENRLLIRRAHKNICVPFIESRSRLDLVAEYAATGERPDEFCDSSSYLLLMILEICLSLEASKRDELIGRYMRRIIKGITDDGKTIVEEEIALQSWVPPEDWADRILTGAVGDGIAVTTDNFERRSNQGKSMPERIRDFVGEMRRKHPWTIRSDAPLAVLILACIKHRSPLPPEFWRGTVFAGQEESGDRKARRKRKKGKTRRKRTKVKGVERPLKGQWPRGKMIYANYKGKKYKAWVNGSGGIRYGGRIYDTPSAAGMVIVERRTCNGWTFWKYKAGSGKLAALKKLRK